MKFLVDTQLPRRLAKWLAGQGCDALHTLDLPQANASTDDEVTDFAYRDGRAVVTTVTLVADQHREYAQRIGISNGLWKPVGSPTDAWVADRCRPGRLGTGICTVVLP